MLKEQIIKALPVVLVSTLLVAAIIYAWIEPTGLPPTGNVPAPINVGVNPQYKAALLGVEGLMVHQGAYLATEVGSNVGIGKMDPGTKLDVAGTARMTGFQLGTTATAGHVLTTNASGVGTWQAPAGGGGGIGGTISVGQVAFGAATNTISGDNSLWWDNASKRLGIGIASPSVKLEVAGQVKITGGSPGAGKVLTSDNTGLASWQVPAGGGGGGGYLRIYSPFPTCEDTDTTSARCTVNCPAGWIRTGCGTYGCSTSNETRAHGVYPSGAGCYCNVWGPSTIEVTVRCYAICATTTAP